jgi:nicotinamide riboside transporter PnuC
MMACKKETKVWIFGIIGVLFFLAGIANVIDFSTGVLLAVIFFIVAGFFSCCRKKMEKKTPIIKKKK